MIDYLPSLLNQAIQRYSCFISYSTKDQEFAARLHADLRSKGVRCWFAPHDLPIGGKILDEIDVAIRLRDKVVLVLSEHSIESDWVEDEVKTAFEEERKRKQIVLFPLQLLSQPCYRRDCAQKKITIFLFLGGPDEAIHYSRIVSCSYLLWRWEQPCVHQLSLVRFWRKQGHRLLVSE